MVQAATQLLNKFRTLPGRVERPRTFMEIAGYPHYENVCSNILAFFLDPAESHGLGSLVFDALASAGNIAKPDEGMNGIVSVEREVLTDSGNRIDLLIGSDSRVILIENKIYASVGNPFPDYAAHLDKVAGERRKHKLLLTIFPTDEGSEWDFTNLTYEEFVDQIRSLLGRYVSSADARYLTMFLDFLNTLEGLHRGTRMGREFVKFLTERSEDIRHLFADLKSFRSELRSKVEGLNDLVEDAGLHVDVAQYCWRPSETVSMYDNLRHDIYFSGSFVVKIDARLDPSGWRIIYSTGRKGDRLRLRSLLQRLDIPFEEEEWFVHSERFAYDESVDRIGPVLRDVVARIAMSRELEE